MICPRREEMERKDSRPRFTSEVKSNRRMNFGTSANATPLGKEKREFNRSNANCTWNKEVKEIYPEENEEELEKTVNQLTIKESAAMRKNGAILMAQWVPVRSPRNRGKVQEVLVFFDTGSQTSYISEELVKDLKPPKIGQGVLEVNTFQSTEPRRFTSGKYIVEFMLRDGRSVQTVLHSSQSFAKGFQAACLGDIPRKITCGEICRNLELVNREPDILIGIADFWKFFILKRDLTREFHLIETTVGPVVCGQFQLAKAGRSWTVQSHVSINQSNKEQLPEDNVISSWWDLQTLGIKEDPDENEDETCMILFGKSIRQVEGRYRTKWLWKEENPNLPSNYGLAFRCLESILRFARNAKLGTVGEI